MSSNQDGEKRENSKGNESEQQQQQQEASIIGLGSKWKRYAANNIADVQSSVSSRVPSVVRSGFSTARTMGTSTVQSTADIAWSGVTQVATKGGSDAVKSVARVARVGLSGMAQTAGAASTTLVGAVTRGSSEAVTVLQWLDGQAKDGVSTTNVKAKDMVLRFTGNTDYTFGDIAKEVMRRGSSSNVSSQDLILLLKVVLTVGASVTPLAKLLPLTVLLDMLNVSIEARIGGKLLEVLAESLDDRFKAAFTAEEMGDLAKRSLEVGILAFTGKETYEAGDIERSVMETQQDVDNRNDATTGTSTATSSRDPPVQQQQLEQATTSTNTFDLRVGPEFEAWDNAFRDTHPGDWEMAIENSMNFESERIISSQDLDMEIVSEIDEWDKKFEGLYT